MATPPLSEEDWTRAFRLVVVWANLRLPNSERWRYSGCGCIRYVDTPPLFVTVGRTMGSAFEQEQARYRRDAEERMVNLALRPSQLLDDGAIRLPDGTILAYDGLIPPWNEVVCLLVAWVLGRIDETQLQRLIRTNRDARTRFEKLRPQADEWIRTQREVRAAS